MEKIRREIVKIIDNRRKLLALVLALMIIGALLSRKWYGVGNTVTLIAIIGYLLVDLKKNIARVRLYKQLSTKGKVRLYVWCALVVVALSLWFGKGLGYFILLVLLALDFLLIEEEK